MAVKYKNEVHRINYLANEIDSIYHLSSLKLGITDSVSIVLYTIYDEGDGCLLSNIYKKTGITKQTVNSAVRRLERDGILFLKMSDGKSKKVMLTDKGIEYVKNTVERLYYAETDAFDAWTDDEINTYIALMEKYTECLRQQIEKL